jgi:C-terminal processing protease CtpA/Prc
MKSRRNASRTRTRTSAGRTLASIAALVLAAGCGGGGDGGDGGGGGGGTTACSEAARKQFALDAAREWYLFPELLPATVNTEAFATAEDLLDHLTAGARAQGRDRFFSYLTTRSEENALLGDGQFVGFGFRSSTVAPLRVFLTEVFEGSPAAEAGLQRGEEIVAVDTGSGFVPVTELLADGSTISDALGPADGGVRRGLRVLRAGTTREVSLVKRSVTLDPVPNTYGSLVLPLAGTAGVGYLHLRSYISTADPQLRDAFFQFRSRGIDYFIVDLRYNGGGLVSTAELIGDLLGGEILDGRVQLRRVYNAAKSARNTTRDFRRTSESVRPVRIAFLTTGATASASEININGLAPWLEIAIVGEDTFGKPVGQDAYDLAGCDDRLRLMTFRNENGLGQGDYFDGLASTLQFACAATDTLEEPLGSPDEGLTAAALGWLATGACPAVIAQATLRSKTARVDAPVPAAVARSPSRLQHWLPGAD